MLLGTWSYIYKVRSIRLAVAGVEKQGLGIWMVNITVPYVTALQQIVVYCRDHADRTM